jgi:stage II sporulation protein AA (anti-sigma F factor antagonist)
VTETVTTAISHYRAGSTTAVIQAPASLDISTAARVRDLAIALIADGVTGIVFDLAATTDLDNTALGVIAGTRARLSPAHGRVAVVAAREPAVSLFQAAGLAKIVLMFATCQEAVSFLRLCAGEK